MTQQEIHAAHPRRGRQERPKPTAEQIEAAEREVIDAAEALDALNLKTQELARATREARSLVAQALGRWITNTPRVTHEQLARDNIAVGNAERAAKAAGTAPPQPKPTVRLNALDCVGLRDDSAEGYARKRMRVGHSRGLVAGQPVFPASQRGGTIREVFDERGNSLGKRIVGPGA